MDETLVKYLWGHEQFEEGSVVCPWCGHIEEYFGFEQGTYDDWECEKCGKTFTVEAYPVMKFTSFRNEDDMPEGWTPEEK